MSGTDAAGTPEGSSPLGKDTSLEKGSESVSRKNIDSRADEVSQESVDRPPARFEGIFEIDDPEEPSSQENVDPGYDKKKNLPDNPLVPTERTRLREKDGEVVPPEIILRRAPARRTKIGKDITVREAVADAECGAFTSEGRTRQFQTTRGWQKFDDAKKVRYCQLMAKYGLKYKVCKAVGVSWMTVTYHLKNDPDFAAAADEALEIFKDAIEEAIHDRAIHGWEEPVYSQRLGCQIGTIHRFDNRLLELLAKRHIPEYRDKQQVDVSVGGGLLLGVAQPSSAEEWVEENRRIVENESKAIEKTDDPSSVELAMFEKQVEPTETKGTEK